MNDLIGFTAISLVFLITLLFAFRWKAISNILLVAFFIRVLFLIINNYFFYLPDGNMDALNFELKAYNWSRDGFFGVFNYYVGPDAYFLSVLLAIPYSLFGRSMLMAQSFSILVSIGSVFLGWLLAKKLWDKRTAIKVGWTIALFPTLVSYSVLTMREAYVTFFLLVAFYGIVKWTRDNNIKSIILAISGFVIACFFHGAAAVGLILFLLVVIFDSLKKAYKLILNKRINIKILIVVFFTSLPIISYGSGYITFTYIGNINQITDPKLLKFAINNKIKGEASFPKWTKVDSISEAIYKVPARSIFFLISPLPWDIKRPKHFIGFFDSILYLYIYYLIFRNRKAILKDPALKIISFLLLSYFIVFGAGTGNFGTGIRHRTKFVIALLLLAAPLIPKLIISKKKKIK